jgi:hypothetical protein
MTAEYAKVKPYRVEWTPHLTTGWILLKACDTRDESAEPDPASAEGVAFEARKKWGGFTRIVSQHVVEVHTPWGVEHGA